MIIEINGVQYQQKERQRRTPSKSLMLMLAMAEMFESFGTGRSRQKETLEVNILEEYGLIQLKKSKLSTLLS